MPPPPYPPSLSASLLADAQGKAPILPLCFPTHTYTRRYFCSLPPCPRHKRKAALLIPSLPQPSTQAHAHKPWRLPKLRSHCFSHLGKREKGVGIRDSHSCGPERAVMGRKLVQELPPGRLSRRERARAGADSRISQRALSSGLRYVSRCAAQHVKQSRAAATTLQTALRLSMACSRLKIPSLTAGGQ